MELKPLYKVNNIRDLKSMVEQSEELYGSKNAFFIKTSDETYKGITYTDFKNDMDALGTSLISLGLKDKFIAVLGENRYEWCLTYLSTVNGTGVIVPLDKELPVSELENLLKMSNSSAIVFSGKFENEMIKIRSSLPSVRYFINMDAEQDNEEYISFKLLIEKGKKMILSGDNSFLNSEIDPEKMNMLIFTSGTTDLAKGVMLSHKSICTDIMSVCSLIFIDSKDSVLSILPLHHTYECTVDFLLMLYNGCTISFNEGLKHIAKNLKEVKPTILISVPLILENMYKKIWDQALKNGMKTKMKIALFISNILYKVFKIDMRRRIFKKVHDNTGGRIRLAISGAAAINPTVSKGFRSMGIAILQGYGLTECSPIVSANTEFNFRDDSIGLPLPCVQLKIDSPNEDGIGEIIVKGDIVMLGYFQNPLATEKVLKDGWLYTGDLGWQDKKGFIRITGRKKNVIVTKNGKNIFPEEVEAYLNKSPYVLESLVWGKYDEESGETLVNAKIVPDFDELKEKYKIDKASKEEVFKIINTEVKAINKLMPLYKHIRQFTIREEEFEKTTTKKIKRYVEKTN